MYNCNFISWVKEKEKKEKKENIKQVRTLELQLYYSHDITKSKKEITLNERSSNM